MSVFGVSRDSLEAHKAFAAKHQLSFPLLVDTDQKIQKAYGSEFPKRHTFVIGKDGKIAYASLDGGKNVGGPNAELLGVLEKLK